MTLSIPYSFTPGTKAKAEEVNADFNYVIENLSDANTNISSLQQGSMDKSMLTNCILKAPNGVAEYSGNVVTVKKGLTILIPDGLNDNGGFDCIEYTLNSNVQTTLSGASTTKTIFLDRNGACQNVETKYILFGDENELPTTLGGTNTYLFYANDKNKWYKTSGSTTADWQQVFYCPIVSSTINSQDNISSITPYRICKVATEMMLDGKFINKDQMLYYVSDINASSTLTFDLSSYLPNDGYDYEVTFTVLTRAHANLGLNARADIALTSDLVTNPVRIAYAIISSTSVSDGASGEAHISVGPAREVTMHQIAAYKASISEFKALGYRRIGKIY